MKNREPKEEKKNREVYLPSAEEIQKELGEVESIDDFFGKEGVFGKLFAKTLEQMLEGEMSDHLGYEKYESKGRKSGNSRNGSRPKQIETSGGSQTIQVPRDRAGEFASPLIEKGRSNELEEKIIALYAKGTTTRDIAETLADVYGVEVSAGTISAVTDKVWPLVEEWQSRPLDEVYPIVFMDALFVKMRHDGRILTTAVYIALAVDMEGRKDVLGMWVGEGAEGANFWLSVLSDLESRGVKDILIACVDGLSGFSEAIEAIYPQTEVQRCIIHQVRQSLRYVVWEDKKEFAKQLKEVYGASSREAAEGALERLAERWGKKYPAAIRSWQNEWEELATFFAYPAEIRRLIYTTNAIESYHRQLRKVTKNKGVFPSPKAVRKLLFLAHRNIAKKWSMPIPHWAKIANQLAIRFEERMKF